MDRLEKSLKALSDKNRIRILKLLENKKMCVCEIAHIIGITHPSVSRHLKKMKSVGLIYSEQDGLWTNYFLTKQDNIHLKTIVKNISEFLIDDDVIKSDLKLAKKINRKDLCCNS